MFEIVMGIDDFLIQLVKYCNPTLNKKNYRCWSFVKKAVDEAMGQSHEQITKLQNS
jgi:hypothetical protein